VCAWLCSTQQCAGGSSSGGYYSQSREAQTPRGGLRSWTDGNTGGDFEQRSICHVRLRYV